MSAVAISREEFSLWARYVHEISGIFLDDSKRYLLETRLGGLIQETGSGGFAELYRRAKSDITNGLRRKIVDAITTNETSFFRDNVPFDLLRHKILPDLIDRRAKSGLRPIPIRIWSAACSTGQEVYSTAIVAKELLGESCNYEIQIIGTDISNKALAQASYGIFSRLEMERGMSPGLIAKYFVPHGDRWKVRDEIRALASFKSLNLLEPFVFPLRFDIVFCRNVAIYFNETDKSRLFSKIAKSLSSDGVLMIGSTESITGLCSEFEPRRHLRGVFYGLKAPGIPSKN